MTLDGRHFALAIALLVSACAQPIVRPAPGMLSLGNSHYADVVGLLGKPTFRNNDVTINHENVRTVDYYTYRFPKTALGNSPHRYLHCTFFNDLLVGEEYNSSYQEDSTWFDASKAQTLLIGKSTRADVISALGPPSGEILYPLVRDRRGRGLVYWYTRYYQRPGMPHIGYAAEPSRLVVFLSDKNVVSDISYRGADGKEHFPGHVTAWPSDQQFPVSPLSY